MSAEHEALTISQILRRTAAALYPVCQEEAAQQSRLLLCKLLGYSSPSSLLLEAWRSFPGERLAELDGMISRRINGEPLQYILGEWDFMGLTFSVRPGVLIPRQDTETLCEQALTLIKERGYQSALDMCCGSGCIGLSLARLGGVSVTLSDISENCVQLAKVNAARLNVTASVYQGSLFSALPAGSRFDLIACNPPYIPNGEIASLQKEVQQEPLLALCGGTDGLDFYRSISAEYRTHLNEGGALLLEVGCGQAESVMEIFGGGRSICDLAGIERVIVI